MHETDHKKASIWERTIEQRICLGLIFPSWITSGANSQFFTVFATTNPVLRTGGISCFIVEKDYPGVVIGKSEEKMGMIGTDMTELMFDNVRLSKDNLLGKEGEGWDIAMATLYRL